MRKYITVGDLKDLGIVGCEICDGDEVMVNGKISTVGGIYKVEFLQSSYKLRNFGWRNMQSITQVDPDLLVEVDLYFSGESCGIIRLSAGEAKRQLDGCIRMDGDVWRPHLQTLVNMIYKQPQNPDEPKQPDGDIPSKTMADIPDYVSPNGMVTYCGVDGWCYIGPDPQSGKPVIKNQVVGNFVIADVDTITKPINHTEILLMDIEIAIRELYNIAPYPSTSDMEFSIATHLLKMGYIKQVN